MPSGIAPPTRSDGEEHQHELESASFHSTKSSSRRPRGDGDDPAARRAHGQRSDRRRTPRGSSCSRRRTARATASSGRRARRPTSQLNTFMPDLGPFKSKLTFLKGIKLNPALQNGMLGGTVGSEHARGTGGMLTGRPLKSGTQFKSFGNTTSGWGSGQSLDQYLVGEAAAEHDLPELAGRRPRARHRGARAHLVRRRGHADPAARGSEGRVRDAVRHDDRRDRDDRSGDGAPVGAAQERVRREQRRDRRGSRRSSASPTATSWTRTWRRCATSRSGWSA